jgi:hypothetical protein
MQILKVAGGWNEVLSLFEAVHVVEMDRCPQRFMVLLIDFDGHADRLQRAQNSIPQHLTERVFIVGALVKPETLRAHLGSYKKIGEDLASDCRKNTSVTWGHPHLQHNAGELDRLREHVRPILFPPA